MHPFLVEGKGRGKSAPAVEKLEGADEALGASAIVSSRARYRVSSLAFGVEEFRVCKRTCFCRAGGGGARGQRGRCRGRGSIITNEENTETLAVLIKESGMFYMNEENGEELIFDRSEYSRRRHSQQKEKLDACQCQARVFPPARVQDSRELCPPLAVKSHLVDR
jgi:hypothetical protein